MTHIRHLATGATTYIPARGLAVAGQVVSRTTSAAALAALGYEWCEPQVENQTEPLTVEETARLEAQQILEDTGAIDAVRRVIARVQAVALLGVDITEWTIQGVSDAAEAAVREAGVSGDLEKAEELKLHGTCLIGEWLRVIYHCRGEILTADRLWPYMYDAVLAL
jgi:hypothetical protein